MIPAGIFAFVAIIIGLLLAAATSGRADGYAQDARDGGERG